jgi:hypothetical protein
MGPQGNESFTKVVSLLIDIRDYETGIGNRRMRMATIIIVVGCGLRIYLQL